MRTFSNASYILSKNLIPKQLIRTKHLILVQFSKLTCNGSNRLDLLSLAIFMSILFLTSSIIDLNKSYIPREIRNKDENLVKGH